MSIDAMIAEINMPFATNDLSLQQYIDEMGILMISTLTCHMTTFSLSKMTKLSCQRIAAYFKVILGRLLLISFTWVYVE